MKIKYLSKKLKANSLTLRVPPIILLLTLTVAFTLGIRAFADNEIRVENCNKCETYAQKLGEEISYYAELDAEPTKSVSGKVTDAINLYRKAILDLQSHPEVSERTLENEIKLEYVRGSTAGRLAWIYYYNIYTFTKQASIDAITVRYNEYSSKIANSEAHSVLSAECEVMASSLNRLIFKEAMQNLAISSDSLSVSALIAGAVNSLENLDSPDLFGEKYRDAYETLKKEITLQRARDALTDELEAVFLLISPSGSFLENEDVALFSYKLKNATLLRDMNEAATACISDLLDARASGLYEGIYKNKLVSRASDVASVATEQGVTASFCDIFADFSVSLEKAKAKDTVYSIIFDGAELSDAELTEIEQVFNADGGRIDACEDGTEIIGEIEIARAKKTLFNSKEDFWYALSAVLGGIDKEPFTERFETLYLRYSDEIYSLESKDSALKLKLSALLTDADEDFDEILVEAKAKRFLNDNESIIKKREDEIKSSDEIIARHALVSYVKLEKSVRLALVSQINSIAEKYNISIIAKATEISPNDAFYLELCEIIFEEIKSIPKENIEEFYNCVDLICQKAVALDTLIKEYRLLTEADNYKGYSEEEKSSLAAVPRAFSEKLCGVNPLDSALFFDSLEDAKSDALKKLHAVDQSARIRISTRNSKSAEISSILNEAVAKIKLASLRSEMISIADKAIFRIERILTRDEITSECERLAYKLEKSKFLQTEIKAKLSSLLSALKSDSSSEAAIAENRTVLEFVWKNFKTSFDKLEADADASELSVATEKFSELISKDLEQSVSKLDAMEYIDSDIRDEIYNKLLSVHSTFKSELPVLKLASEVEALYEKSLKELTNIIIAAENESLEAYKLTLCDKLSFYKDLKENYSVENYNKILELIANAKEELKKLTTKESCDGLIASLNNEIAKINDILDDERDIALASLLECFEKCKKSSPLYSKEAFASIEAFYSEAKQKLESFSNISDVDTLKETLSEYLGMIYAVRKDKLYSSDDALNIDSPSLSYPEGYDFSEGLWASVELKNGILGNASLSVRKNAQEDFSSVEDAIRRAAKSNSLRLYSPLSGDISKLLGSASVAMALDISLSQTAEGVSGYELKILMPRELLEENILGLAFLDGDNVEFYPVYKLDSLIITDLEHFSKFYVVVEGTLNVKPLLIFLIILLMAEFALLIGILYFRSKKKREIAERISNLPDIPLSAFIPSLPALTKIVPKNGAQLAILLSVSALALALTIALLLRAEIKENKAKSVKNATRYALPEGQKRLKAGRKQLLLEDAKNKVKEKNSKNALEENDLFFQGIPQDGDADEKTLCLIGARKNSERRAEITLDLISDSFSSGDTVNLEELKKKHLVPEDTDYVRILASGRLTKPLKIEAREFSNTAIEILRLSGGEAKIQSENKNKKQ